MNGRSISSANIRGGLIVSLLCFLSCEFHAVASTNEQRLATANTAFAFNLLQQIATEQPGSNIFISPYSVSSVLQMTSTGAAGSTQTQMQEVLGTIDMRPAALNEASKEMDDIIDSKNTNFILDTANAIWYRCGFPIKPSFVAGNQQFFGATVDALNFNEPSAVDVINAWASKETHGKIDQIVSSIDSKVRLFLANAVYFHGNWQTQFNTNDTTNGVFHLSGGGQEMIPLMTQTGSFSYCAGNDCQAVRLPYKGGNLAMYVFLPGPDSSLENLLGMMNGPWWQQTIQADFSEQQGTVVLPKFNLNYAIDLVQPLETLGMTTAFTPEADFSNITTREPLSISAVRQQAVVDVDELGTEAAAVTTVTVVATVVTVNPIPPFQMVVDRPFLFAIVDQQAGTILFMGMVFNP